MHSIAISTQTHYFFIKHADIIYLEADSNYTHIYTSKDKHAIVTAKSLGYFEALLSMNEGFIRIHDKYIINAEFITSIEKGKSWLLTIQNTELPVSAGKKEALKKYLKL